MDAWRFFLRRRRCLACGSLFFAVNFAGAAPDDFFARGVAAYQAGAFPEAAAAFEKSAQTRPAAGTFLNLGLAEWQRGHAGAAMLAWEKARWLRPRDPRAAENLKFARAVTQVAEPPLTWFETASTWLPSSAWMWLAGASLWLAVGALVVPRFFRWRRSGWPQWLAALAAGIFLFSLTANLGVVSRTHLGLVLRNQTPLRLTPTRDGEAITTLAGGEPVRWLRTRGNYYFVRTGDGSGWIERGALGLVNE